jgi:ferredoxin/flavodoxin---NADP+ reductase
LNNIIRKEKLAANIHLIEVVSEELSSKILPGQFVILRVRHEGERVPLTVVKKDPEKKSIVIIFQVAGKTTELLSRLKVGDSLTDLVGPLGIPTEIKNHGTVAIIGGGVGVAEILPVSRALREAGNKVICIIGARNKEMLILENEVKGACDRLYVTTDDGSYAEKGFVSDVLKRLISEGLHINLVYAVGPVPMMRIVSNITKDAGIHTMVSLNTVMVDGTGMCGSCRITVGNETKCACVDGPEFDGHLVDWKELENRLKLFVKEEEIARKTL